MIFPQNLWSITRYNTPRADSDWLTKKNTVRRDKERVYKKPSSQWKTVGKIRIWLKAHPAHCTKAELNESSLTCGITKPGRRAAAASSRCCHCCCCSIEGTMIAPPSRVVDSRAIRARSLFSFFFCGITADRLRGCPRPSAIRASFFSLCTL